MTEKLINVVDFNETKSESNDNDDFYPTTKVLVFGKGYIGKNISDFLASDNGLEIHNIEKSQVDYTDKNQLIHMLNRYYEEGIIFNTFINAVGYTGETNIDDAEDNKELCWLLNSVLPITLASVAQQFNVEKFINISSGCIFNGPATKHRAEWYEKDVPNFGLFNEDSSFYSKSKHAAELALSRSFNKVYNLRIRMPFGEIDSHRNLLQKLLKYEYILNEPNTVTYIYDLFNYIHKLIALNDTPYGVYNVVSNGNFTGEMFFDVVKEKKDELIKAKLLTKEHFEKMKLVSLDEFYKNKLTKAKRSNILMSNQSACNDGWFNFSLVNKELISNVFDSLIE